jgi:4-amino-4-deoxy-L-arabinose transferase-like glycosyltransferase
MAEQQKDIIQRPADEFPKEKVLRISTGWALVGVLVGVMAAILFFPPALVNEAPFHDDKAYINNALIASGRVTPEMVRGPFAEERPPLFWWLITGLLILGAPIESVRWVSPLIASIGVVGIYFLASRLFNDFRIGLLSAAFISVSDFFILTTSYILTDSMGSIIAALAIICFSLGLRDGVFMWLAGPLVALSIIARDQNLLIVPVIVLSLVWMSRLRLGRKIAILMLLGVALAPALILPQERILQIVSDLVTPIFRDPAYLYILVTYLSFMGAVVYKVAVQRNLVSRKSNVGERIFDIGLALGLALLLLHPFFIDNIRLGDTFQIAGKGILSRPIAHAIMARELGIGAQLPFPERVSTWTWESIKLLTLPLLMLSILGAVMIMWRGVRMARPLMLWGLLSLLYVILFTHLEYRFLAQAVPPLAVLAAYALARLWRVSRVLPAILIPLTIFFLLFPAQPSSPIPDTSMLRTLQGLNTLMSGPAQGGWLTQYIAYLKTITPANTGGIDPMYPLLGLTTIPILFVSIYVGLHRITIPLSDS